MGKIVLVIAFFLMGSIYMLNIEKESIGGVLFNNPAESNEVAYYKTTEPKEGAFSFLIPANWKISGGITRVEQEAKLYLKLTSPDDKTTVCWLPEMEFIVPENRSRNIDNTVDEQLKIKSLLTPADFVLTIAVPFAHPHAATIKVTDVKPITPVKMFSLSGEMNAANRQAAEVTISYWENGVFFKEKITCVIESYTENGDKKWRNFSTWYVRGDNNSFEAFEPIFSKIISSVQLNKEWEENENRHRQIASPHRLSSKPIREKKITYKNKHMKCFSNKSIQASGQKNQNFFLTGATGILGSHLLFELLQKYIRKEFEGKIVLMVRPDRKNTAEQRVLAILTSSSIPVWLSKIPVADLLSHIEIVESGLNDFSADKLPIGIKNYTVIHAAASVNLGVNEHSGIEIEENNFKGTLRLLHEITPFASQFVYVSTAYSSGHRTGNIDNDFLSLNELDFRNPYEFFKNKTEKYIEQYCPLHGVDWKIFRPSIICGRLIDAPYYAIPRFMVFYLFARYAVTMKSRMDGTTLRLHVPENAQINIVPVDFVAKVIMAALPSPIKQLNIVHPQNASCRSLFKNGFGLINFSRYSFIETLPVPENPVEKMLYCTVGQQLGPYIDTPSHHFDTSALKKIMPDFSVPDIEPHFGGLLEFAANRKFAPLY